jgi:hypothetical protein
MSVELSVVEQRYQAVLAVIRGGPCRGALQLADPTHVAEVGVFIG